MTTSGAAKVWTAKTARTPDGGRIGGRRTAESGRRPSGPGGCCAPTLPLQNLADLADMASLAELADLADLANLLDLADLADLETGLEVD